MIVPTKLLLYNNNLEIIWINPDKCERMEHGIFLDIRTKLYYPVTFVDKIAILDPVDFKE